MDFLIMATRNVGQGEVRLRILPEADARSRSFRGLLTMHTSAAPAATEQN